MESSLHWDQPQICSQWCLMEHMKTSHFNAQTIKMATDHLEWCLLRPLYHWVFLLLQPPSCSSSTLARLLQSTSVSFFVHRVGASPASGRQTKIPLTIISDRSRQPNLFEVTWNYGHLLTLSNTRLTLNAWQWTHPLPDSSCHVKPMHTHQNNTFSYPICECSAKS